MNRVAPVLLLIGSLWLAQIVQAQPVDTVTVEHPTLRSELLKMAQIDQEVRQFVYGSRGAPPDSATLAHMDSTDAVHTARLKEIVEQYGWPDNSLVGQDGANAAHLIVQHSPDWDFQERVLPLLRQAYERGEADGQAVALLTDRVRVHRGEPQLYGTQYQIEEGQVVFTEIENPDDVDERREELGMPPLEFYRKLIEEMTGIEDHGLFDD